MLIAISHQKVQPILLYQPIFKPYSPPSIHPSSSSGLTVPIKANAEDVYEPSNKQNFTGTTQEDDDLDRTMTMHNHEDILPSRELAHSPTANVTMPTNSPQDETPKAMHKKAVKDDSSSGKSHLQNGSPEVDNDTSNHGSFCNSFTTSDYYPPDVPQYPNAMPTPLFGRSQDMPMSPPGFPAFLPTPPPGYSGPIMMPGPGGQGVVLMPDGSNLLTHFDVLNRHIMDVSNSLHQSQAAVRDQVLAEASARHAENKAASEQHETTVKQAFEKLEEKVDNSTMNAECILANSEQLLEHVRNDLSQKLNQVLDHNRQILTRFEAMQKEMIDLSKKFDDTRANMGAEVVRALQSNTSAFYNQSNMPSQSMQAQMVFMDSQGRVYGTGTAPPAQMQVPNQAMYNSMPMHSGKDDRMRRNDEWGHQRGAQNGQAGGENGYGKRGYYNGGREGSNPRLHDGNGYAEGGASYQRRA